MSAKKEVRFFHTNPDNAGEPMGPFDRSKLFSCFQPWVESIRTLRDEDPEKAADAFLVLADYCLYAREPDPETNPWGFAWETVKSGADASIKNRSRRFGTKDVDKRDRIARYFLEHPEESQREIAAATGCSLGLVNEVVQTLRAARDAGACSIDYNSYGYSYPRGLVLEQNTLPDVLPMPAELPIAEEEPPELEEVLGPHQPDAPTERGSAY